MARGDPLTYQLSAPKCSSSFLLTYFFPKKKKKVIILVIFLLLDSFRIVNQEIITSMGGKLWVRRSICCNVEATGSYSLRLKNLPLVIIILKTSEIFMDVSFDL